MKVLLAGGGRTAYFLAHTLLAKAHSVVVIDRDAADCAALARQLQTTVVHGDASDLAILEEAGARGADVVLAATESDPDNLVVCQMAQSRFGVPRVFALVNDPENQAIFRDLGIDAISTSLTVASLIEQRAALDQVTNLIPAGEGRVLISEVELGATSPVLGRPLATIGVPHDALIAVVMRDGSAVIPHGTTQLHAGDRVLLITLSDSREKVLRFLTGQVD